MEGVVHSTGDRLPCGPIKWGHVAPLRSPSRDGYQNCRGSVDSNLQPPSIPNKLNIPSLTIMANDNVEYSYGNKYIYYDVNIMIQRNKVRGA